MPFNRGKFHIVLPLLALIFAALSASAQSGNAGGDSGDGDDGDDTHDGLTPLGSEVSRGDVEFKAHGAWGPGCLAIPGPQMRGTGGTVVGSENTFLRG